MVPGLGRHGGAPCAGETPSPSRLETSVAVTTPTPQQLPKASLPQFPSSAVRQHIRYPKLLRFWAQDSRARLLCSLDQKALGRPMGEGQGRHSGC